MTATIDQPTLEVPRVAIDQIRVHPLNPRIDAVADADMVESIRRQGVLEPVMLAPAPDGEGWILIDGHRRFDGAQQAGVPDVPANPRYDLVTEAQQVEVMVVTGLQKALLSPVEEAAGYEQLTLLGLDVDSIAASTGFSRARVKQRMKLNDLGAVARAGVHDGQLTLGDAEAFTEFADDPAATTELEESIGTPNFRHQIAMLRSRRDRLAARAAVVEGLVAAGGRPVEPVPGQPGYVRVEGEEEERQALTLRSFPEDQRNPEAHDGCLGFSVPASDYSDVSVVCIDLARHDLPDTTAAQQIRESQWEKDREARAADRARREAAAQVRLDWLIEHFASMFPTRSHQPLAAAARAALPLIVDETDLDLATPTAGLAAFAKHFAEQVAYELDRVATFIDDPDMLRHHLALWDWAKAAGYQLADVDVEICARLESKLLEVTTGDGDG